MENCDMSHGKIVAWKLAIISFTILVLRWWTSFHDWVFGLNIWWLVAVFVISLMKSGCCNSSSNKTTKKATRKKK